MDMERNSLFTLQVKGEDKTREELQGASENTEQRAETLGPGETFGSQGKRPSHTATQAIEGAVGGRALLHMKFFALLCYKTPFLLQNHQ